MADYMHDEHGNAYTLPGPFHDVRDIEREHRSRGGFYFDSGPAFAARFHEVVAGAVMIDSTRDTWHGGSREYRLTVIQHGRGMARIPDPETGAVKFATLRQARAAAKRVCDACGVKPWEVDHDGRPWEWKPVSAERRMLARIAAVSS